VARLSIIVPIFNGLRYLPAFFDSLRLALPAGSEVILVDDASTEPVFEAVPDDIGTGTVTRMRNERNLGYAATVNRGFRAATGEIIVQLNTDLILEPRTITAMIDVIERENDVGLVGSKLVYPTTGLIQHVGMAFGNLCRLFVFYELPSWHPLCGRTREVQIIAGATVAMTSKVLEQLGPLDEGYFNNNEDIDHCLRAVHHGLRNFICADSVAYHWESQSGPARFARLKPSEAAFWSRWGGRYEVDLGTFIDEALDHLLDRAPHLQGIPFEILNLSRGTNDSIVLERLDRRWPGVAVRVRHVRQMNNPSPHLWLPFVLPHWVSTEPVPFIYLVDRYRELEENFHWFKTRRGIVSHDLIADLNGVVMDASELRLGDGRDPSATRTNGGQPSIPIPDRGQDQNST
jgi:GT2 family glycosyltransferase